MANWRQLFPIKFLAIYKKELIIFLDMQVIFWAYVFSFFIRFDFNIPIEELKIMIYTFPLVFIIKIATYIIFRIYNIIWRYTSVQDLFLITKTSIINNVLYGIIFYVFFQWQGYPRSIILIDCVLFIMLSSGMRIFYRNYFEKIGLEYRMKRRQNKKRCMIIGAGDGGEGLIRSMLNNQIPYDPVCIIDNNKTLWNNRIHGINIYGPIDRVSELAQRYKVEEIIIAIPSATEKTMREILDHVEPCKKYNISYKTVPSLNELVSGQKSLTAIRDIKLEDLINRKMVKIDKSIVMEELRDNIIFVTGAAGSIGSELVRQISGFNPRLLVLMDRNENNLMYLSKEIDDMKNKVNYRTYIVDVTDEIKIDQLFNKYKPNYIFHAAAYKHVPFMENSPNEAIKNNVYGTKILANAAEKHKSYKFVLISTDKAVNPVNVMGCTKKLSELFIQNNFRNSNTKFIIVRFGNVIGSEGSIVPIFRRQISRGKAVTVTHPDMCRYLMTIPEAVSLTLEAASMGNHRDILILDMGEQIKILEIAENLIRLSGYQPYVDIPIKFTGIRPGEKLYEELWDEYETPTKTNHPKIFRAPMDDCENKFDFELFNQLINSSLKHEKIEKNRKLMKKLVPTYKDQEKSDRHEKQSA